MSKKTKVFVITALTAGALVLGLAAAGLAQEDAGPAVETSAETGGETILGQTEEQPLSEIAEAVFKDTEVTTDDLGAKEATIKPDSIFHPFKHLGRNVQEMLTFDPVKDAELKLKHANQELSEIKQLIAEKGIENVDPDDIKGSVEWFEKKLEKIKDASADIKEQKKEQPAEVETLLNNLIDKQIKEYKILDKINEEITGKKETIEEAEDMFAAVRDKQNEALNDFGVSLTIIDDPEKIPERINIVADGQSGSEFKLIKITEILEKLEEQLPKESKEPIEKAQEKTLMLLQKDIQEMPAIVRAENFKDYAEIMPGDETIQLGIFEKIKQLPDVPQDILEKIEAVKEFAVQRFETKVAQFKKPEVKDKFFANLEGDDLDDIVALEELKAKISARQEEIKKKVDQEYTESVKVFKNQFTDVKSREQAERFERLVKEMTSNPNPKIFKLIKELEEEVVHDPEKRAFIEEIKNKSKAEFENKFRQEGERFFDRMASLNPEEMMVFHEFDKEQFLDPKIIDQFLNYQTDKFRGRVQAIDNPEMFNRFDERMRFAPTEVVNLIKTYDTEFSNVMQFKARKMMEEELQLKEREMRMAMERAWRDAQNDFELQLRQTRTDEEKQRLYAEKRERDFALTEKEFEQRKKIMETRFENDPFCDESCRNIQRQYIEQDLQQKKWGLKEDARMREFQLEMDMQNKAQQNPFYGKCDGPETCMNYCSQNPDFPACRIHQTTAARVQEVRSTPPPCPAGEINMPAGPNRWICTRDPYSKPAEFIKNCPPGHFWNEKGFCQFDMSKFIPPADMRCGDGRCDTTENCPQDCQQAASYPGGMPRPIMPSVNFCGQGEYWDEIRGCMRDEFNKCPSGQFFDFFENRCASEWQPCPPGEYWDPGRQSCIRDIIIQPIESCPPGEFFDFYKKRCIREIICPTVMPGPCQPGENPVYNECGPSCIPAPVQCPPDQRWDEAQKQCVGGAACPTYWKPVCGNDNITYSNECFAKMARVEIKNWSECGMSCGPNKMCGPGQECMDYGRGICCERSQILCPNDSKCVWTKTDCLGYVIPPTPAVCPSGMISCSSGRCVYSIGECSGATTGWCGDKICNNNETASSCQGDCGGTPTTCPANSYIKTDGSCNYATCPSGCNFSNGCPSSCMSSPMPTTCPSNMANNYTSSFSCSNTNCPSGCVFDSQGCPSSCMTSKQTCASMGGTCCNTCANGSYLSGTECNCCRTCVSETCPVNSYTTSSGICNYGTCPNGCHFGTNNCPDSCSGTLTGNCGGATSQSACTSQGGCIWCEGESTPYSCFGSGHQCAGTGSASYCNYDGICNNSESSGTCPNDCRTTTACPTNSYANMDGSCNSGTCPSGCNFSNGCPSSCMSSPMPTTCPSNMANNYTSSYTCSNTNCPSGCVFDSQGCPSSCTTPPSTTGYCGDKICNNNETASSCQGDCGGTTTGSCGNSICESSETSSSCPSDCGGTPTTGSCGNSICESSETSSSCPSDCYAAPVSYCGDGRCDSATESSSNCTSDCGMPPVTSYCGDGACNNGETSESCSSDCGAPLLPGGVFQIFRKVFFGF